MFGTLLNAHDILGASGTTSSDLDEGEIAFQKAYDKLHHPTPSISGSMGASLIPHESYSSPSESFSLAVAVDPRIKLRILKGLFVPFKVLLATSKGLNVNQYLRNPFMTPENDPKLRTAVQTLTIKRWTDAFLVYMHFYCMRFLDQREHMYKYMQIIHNMEQSAPQGAWMGYDRELRVLHQADPLMPWQALHLQLYFFHIARISVFTVTAPPVSLFYVFSLPPSPGALMQQLCVVGPLHAPLTRKHVKCLRRATALTSISMGIAGAFLNAFI